VKLDGVDYHGLVGGQVVVVYGARQDDLNPRWDLACHSPAGFGWGYGGSGPAQLALGLASDVLHRTSAPHPRCRAAVRRRAEQRWDAIYCPACREASRLHQYIKARMVAPLPQGVGWTMAATDILAAITEAVLAHPAPPHADE